MLRYDVGTLRSIQSVLDESSAKLRHNFDVALSTSGFTTSPALGSVASQYTAYLSGHPGSLSVATQAAVENVRWLAEHLSGMTSVLENQERFSVDSFSGRVVNNSSPDAGTVFRLPHRTNIPVLDLGYGPPIAAVEATTPLKTLTMMFAGDDSGIVAGAELWTAASTRMTEASEALQRAASLLGANTQGTSFEFAQQAMSDVSVQCATVASNAQAMATSMLQLPPVRAAAHAQLVALEAEMAAEATAAGAATGGTGAAAVAAQSQARVAAFVSGYLQPALDSVRPVVANLTVPVVGHTGGGDGAVGATGTMPVGETMTQVAGGAVTPGAGAAASQPAATVPQVSQVATAPAGGATAAPVSPTGVTTPVGGTAASPSPGASAGVGAMPAGVRSPGAAASPPTAGAGAALGADPRSTAGATRGAVSGVSGGTGGGPRGRSSVVQPLLPRSISPTGGPRAGAGGPGAVGGPGSSVGHGARGGAVGVGGPGAGVPRGTSPGSPGAAGVRAGTGTGTVGPAMMGGGAGAGARGSAGAGGRHQGRSAGKGGIAGVGGARGVRGRTGNRAGLSAVQDYFRRQFLGEKPRTVKRVIR
jgi:hypothetical protein